MSAQATGTRVTATAAKIDLSDNPLADELLRSFNNAADEFVAGHARKPHVALEDLQICGADAGEVNLD